MSSIQFVGLGPVDQCSQRNNRACEFVAIEADSVRREPAEIIDLHVSHIVTRLDLTSIGGTVFSWSRESGAPAGPSTVTPDETEYWRSTEIVDGDTVFLRDPNGNIVASLTYGESN